MMLSELARTDHLVARFMSRVDPLASGDDALDEMLDIVERYTGELMPATVKVDLQREVRYSRVAVKKQFDRRDRKFPGWDVLLLKESKPELFLTLRFHRTSEIRFLFYLKVLPFDFYQDKNLAQERADQLISFVREMACHFPPVYGFGHSETDESMGSDPHYRNVSAPKRVYEAYWLNVYGKEMVEALGRKRVLSTPATHLEELPDGSVLFLTRPTPGDFASDEARNAQARALVHLKPELSFDSVLAGLRQRSAQIAPVERQWDPDLVELLDLTLDFGALKDRQRETARLNEWRPPPVSEWMPLAEAPPCDDEDGGRAMLSYINVQSEGPVVMFQDEVPEAIQGGPESLTPLDYEFWVENFPRWKSPDVLAKRFIPAVGAYLGEMMVRYLGGRWGARRKLIECYVVLGDRAYLPFLRALHYFRSKQSVLDYSMTQFYREAERYVRSRSGQE